MTARHEVNLTIQVRTFTIADTEQSALDNTFKAVDRILKNMVNQDDEIQIDEVELEDGDATAI